MVEAVRLAFDAIGLCQVQYDQVDNLWGYFSVVTLAVVGFVVSRDKAVRSMRESFAIVAAYIVFCISNNIALYKGQKLLYALAERAMELSGAANIPLPELRPLSPAAVWACHLSMIVAVSLGTLLVAFYRVRAGQKA
ncbi:hypothetical protein [Pseudodesulfovibrio sp.]|uniref:hypothetical protein n=1 Tax=unclassified Pseudodesulfovibrio TaxID=2661612 RepID=UPI003AFFA548